MHATYVANLYDAAVAPVRDNADPRGTALVRSSSLTSKGGSEMTRRIMNGVIAIGAFAAMAYGVQPAAAADDPCFYKGTMFSDGATACQGGKQYKCDDGEWEKRDQVCQEGAATTSKACDFQGVQYATGSAKCDAGTQFRCEDGAWKRLNDSCPVGDAPIRVAPSGRTCMYEGATVSNSSTICRTGSTFLCNDGEWVNLGTQCR
jgi:hypothetical protein